jgi:hypothetical protein
MHALDKYPDVMTVKEVADFLRVKPCTVYSIKDLKKIRLGEGKGFIRVLREDFISYIESCFVMLEREEDGSLKEKRQRKVGIPGLLPWTELQAILVQDKRRCVTG